MKYSSIVVRNVLLGMTFCIISITTLFAQDSIVAKFVARSHNVRSGVFRSTNSGTSWSSVNYGLPADCSVLACAISGSYLFAGTDVRGVFRSTDNGTSWTVASTGLPTKAEVTAFAVSPNGASGANLFAGINGDGVFRSTDNGTSWTIASGGLTAPYVRALATSGANLFAGSYSFGGGVFLSSDNGTSWTKVSKGLTNTNVYALVVNGTDLFAGTYGAGVFRSTDNGTSWTVASGDLTAPYVRALAMSGTNLFAATEHGGVYVSSNNGTSWTSCNYGLTNLNVFAIAVNGSNLFAGMGDGGGGVFRSTDSGAHWADASSPGLTITNVNTFAFSGTYVFAGTDKGVTLPYRLFIPDNYSHSQKYPLVLTLHGSGERGTDNYRQLGRLATSWADPVNQVKYPCIVLAPQCPPNGAWWDDAIVAANIDLMDSLISEFTIDTNRLYITGLSMGGSGTWDMITRFPDRFAAAIPMSGGAAPAIIYTPIWNFHGAQDPVGGINPICPPDHRYFTLESTFPYFQS